MSDRINVVIRGAGVLVVAGVLATGAYIVNEEGEQEAAAAVWVDTTGQACTRSATPITFEEAQSNGWLCDNITDGYNEASAGDTVRVKAGDYGANQSVGGKAGARITIIGEEGATTTSSRASCGDQLNTGLSFDGNVTVDNIDSGGAEPFVYMGGDGSYWQNSTLEESSDANTCPGARGSATGGTPEPVLIYTDVLADIITDARLSNMVFEPQHVCTPGVGTCSPGDVYHLETVRIDQYVDGVIIENSVFQDGGEDGTAHVFIPAASSHLPKNITVRNSYFGTKSGSLNIDGGWTEDPCENWVFAYNIFRQGVLVNCQTGGSVTWIGNVMSRSNSGCGMTGGHVWIENVIQWSSDPRCGGHSGDQWVNGTNFGLDGMDIDADGRPQPGSVLIDAGETPDADDYCTGALGSVDMDGVTRPIGSACDAGPFEEG